ncbi:MAG TPA: NAD(+)/NADH kinase [Candidatus Dormibacteraeota bacterium]|nr:NAD(+)/NADH kinase [Candidatus Dormibacteraeota bacterium]
MIACIVSGPGAPEAILKRAEASLASHGVECWQAQRDQPESAITARLTKTDLLVTLGGDGTFLAGARLAGPRGIPLLGVNLGRLGFLTELEEDQLETGIDGYIAGKHRIEERTILQVELLRGSRRVARTMGLNEVVVNRAEDARMLRVQIEVGGQGVGVIDADGVIVATATGSTAYALASGGPILEPTLRDLLLVPMNPFALTVRPIVFSPQQDIVLSIVRGPAEMRVDGGRRGRAVATGDTLRCAPHPRRLKVIRFGPPEDFYRRLGDKLGWGRPLVPMK